MNVKEIKTKFDNSRLSNKTTPTTWKRIRNISGTVATIGTILLAAPVSIPAGVSAWITYLILISGSISGTSHLTKK